MRDRSRSWMLPHASPGFGWCAALALDFLAPGGRALALATREGTIYGLYQSRFGINVVRIKERMSAAHADSQTAKLLEISVSAPVLMIKRVAYTYHDAPVEMRTSWVNTAQHEYLSDLWKSEGRFSGA